MAEQSTHTSASFAYANADIILRSGDRDAAMDFRVHRLILSLASPFFETTLSLPQNPAQDTQIPVVNMVESSEVIDALLRYIYPIANPSIEMLETLSQTLSAAIKYDIDIAVQDLRKRLVHESFLQSSPLMVFAIALKLDLKEELQIATKQVVRTKITDVEPFEELKDIDAYLYARLVRLWSQRCSQAVDIANKYPKFSCQSGGARHNCHTWWHQYITNVCNEVSQRPSTTIISAPLYILNSYLQCEFSRGLEHAAGMIKKIDDLQDTLDLP
ncbi:hypothetical protein QCA50_015058 [Cerrena zonata]|uniref:BTB domain-containing protein n=1 Tax=Cerrena zonata TaxID=2478898 RepID=A0AAW0FM28_9APHY